MKSDEVTPEIIGKNIRRQREYIGLSVTRLAKAIGVCRNTLANYESGKTEPTATDIVRITNAVGCTFGDIMSAEPVPLPRFTHIYQMRQSQ